MNTPELDKIQAVKEESQVIGLFLENSGYVLAEYVKPEGYTREELVPVGKSINQILADYFEIDLSKVEEERMALLEELRAGQI